MATLFEAQRSQPFRGLYTALATLEIGLLLTCGYSRRRSWPVIYLH